MAGEDRSAAHSLIARLVEKPYAFDFFRAARLLECAFPNLPRIGTSVMLSEDAIRFGQLASLAFAPSAIASCELGANGAAPRLSVNFFGLLGPNGPMPLYFTEYVRRRALLDHDPALSRFLDVFHHRMIALFYRAWANHQMAVSRDRPDQDRFATYIGSLLGIGMTELQRRDSVQDEAKLFYAGRLSCQVKHAEGLCAVLADYFEVDARIDEFVGQWIDLPTQYQLRMGESPETGALGLTSIVGSRFWDCGQKIRIVLGPLTFRDFERFLPGARSHQRLADWVRNYIGGELDADLQLILLAAEVPPVELGTMGRLGWTTWLTSEPPRDDAADLILLSIAA